MTTTMPPRYHEIITALATNDVRHGGAAMQLQTELCWLAIDQLWEAWHYEERHYNQFSADVQEELRHDLNEVTATERAAHYARHAWYQNYGKRHSFDNDTRTCDIETAQLVEAHIDEAPKTQRDALVAIAGALRTGDYSALSLTFESEEE